MGKKKRTQSKRPAPAATPEGGALAGWFTEHLSRRSASQRLGKGMAWASVLGMAGVSLYKFTADADQEVSLDSLELQRREGWDVGSAGRQLIFPTAGLIAVDSQRRADWNTYLDPNRLIAVYQPPSPQWQPFLVPTLMQSLAQSSLRAQTRAIQTPEMVDTYQRAEGLRELLSQAQNAAQTLVVADLDGPAAVALGAALSDTAQLVPAFDNWPHPLGVVRSHETIGALLFYAHEVEQKKAQLPANAPALMLLDSQRLSPYRDEDTQFDNRYLAKLPPADQLKQRGVSSVIYLVKDEGRQQELDDLNDDFVEWQKNGVEVRWLRLSDFKPVEEEVQAAPAGVAAAGAPAVVRERHYYYGGSPLFHWWFYNHYFYRPYPSVIVVRGGRSVPLARPSSPPPFQPPAYRPVSRPTLFSGTRVGGASGVGRARPSGFGRTSVRMSGGRVTGTRRGRSGSYGRSGGWFSGFGG
jgi:hypothetical protein